MKRKFVVCVDDATKEQQDSLTQFFEKADVGYWHWFSDLWLVADPYNKWSATSLRDKTNEILPGAHSVVIQIDDSDTWSGFGNPKMFEWFRNTWDKLP